VGVLVVDAEQTTAGGAVLVNAQPFVIGEACVRLRSSRETIHRGGSGTLWIQDLRLLRSRTQASPAAMSSQCLYNAHHAGNPAKKSVCCAPHLRINPPRGSDRTDKADDFLAESHSRTQDPGVRFEGWRGLPKMNQASPREAGHKPAF
jgi:hypothetical protein